MSYQERREAMERTAAQNLEEARSQLHPSTKRRPTTAGAFFTEAESMKLAREMTADFVAAQFACPLRPSGFRGRCERCTA